MLTFQHTRRWLLTLAAAILLAASVESFQMVLDNLVGTSFIPPALAGDHEDGGCG